ncbi:tyrosine-type recombinase/integrase [Mycolicibacterium llatzerense]|uniref:tyrosine-type recombinase/integrase n=1 Tax=Mycobacteriaceae TaxID=1762 RepID=UPI001F401E89|nr:site-specific integrase [Mycolicibacterium llatzerense]
MRLTEEPSDGWQGRWLSSGAEDGPGWVDDLFAPEDRGSKRQKHDNLMMGLRALLLCRIVFPGYGFLTGYRSHSLFSSARGTFRPELFAQIERRAAERSINSNQLKNVLALISKILLHTGKDVDQLTAEDLLAYRAWTRSAGDRTRSGLSLAWRLLDGIADLHGFHTIEEAGRFGQRTCGELVDDFGLRNRTVRDVIVRYLEERRASLDYASLDHLAKGLAGRFWADIELHHPEVESLHLPEDVALAWKRRIQTSHTLKANRTEMYYVPIFQSVRAFYLDLQEWAMDDPSWAAYCVPSPVRKSDIAGSGKEIKKSKAAIHQRIRERLPHLPVLVDGAERYKADQAGLLAALKAVEVDETFEHSGRRYRRTIPISYRRNDYKSDTPPDLAEDLVTGEVLDVSKSEPRAFWAWAAIETLRHTGVRVEELVEITHLALVSYRLPKTRELVPMLQIVPSKSNEERLLLVSPELASVLATVITRLRHDNGGSIPLTKRYDNKEKVTGPALPHLFQHRLGGNWYIPSTNTIQSWLNETLGRTGLVDAAGSPLRYTPHDFRRMFATDAVSSGLPIHIVSRLLGHKNVNTTQGYTAVFPEQLVRTYRAFLDTRRQQRPEAEYREPTNEEWSEFQQHFELRKLELGTCGRPYGTPCKHEHACIRCPSLRLDPKARNRLTEIIANLRDRIAEANSNGWTGEVEGLNVSLNAAAAKLTSLDRMNARAAETGKQATDLGIPIIIDVGS